MPILQINFKLNVSTAEYQKICESVAQAIADVPGLRWKVWLLDEKEKEAGGIYLFQDEEALNNYLSSPIVAQIKNHPALQGLSAKRFDVMEEVTAVTRGPIPAMAAA
jgi:Putative mono-oxygenase ydhR